MNLFTRLRELANTPDRPVEPPSAPVPGIQEHVYVQATSLTPVSGYLPGKVVTYDTETGEWEDRDELWLKDANSIGLSLTTRYEALLYQSNFGDPTSPLAIINQTGTVTGGSYTDEQAQDAAAAMFATLGHTGITFTYDDATNTMTAAVTGGGGGYTDEQAQDAVAAAFAVGTFIGVTVSYNDAANALSITNTDRGSTALTSHNAMPDPHSQYILKTAVSDTSSIDLNFSGTTLTASLIYQHSIGLDAGGVKLINDQAAPGNSMLYGTDAAGFRGWYPQPSGGSAYTNEEAQDAAAAMILAGAHFGISFSYNDAANALSATVSYPPPALTGSGAAGELALWTGATSIGLGTIGSGSNGAVLGRNPTTGVIGWFAPSALGISTTVYTDEQSQDAAAAMLLAGTHTGIAFLYDDVNNKLSAAVSSAVALHRGRMSRETPQTGISHATWTKIGFDNTQVNVGGVCDQGNGRLIIQRTGKYQIFAAAAITLNSGQAFAFGFRKNGSGVAFIQGGFHVAQSGSAYGFFFDLINANAGDFFELWLIHFFGSNQSTRVAPEMTYFGLIEL